MPYPITYLYCYHFQSIVFAVVVVVGHCYCSHFAAADAVAAAVVVAAADAAAVAEVAEEWALVAVKFAVVLAAAAVLART